MPFTKSVILQNASESACKGSIKNAAPEPLQAATPNRCPEGIIPIESKKVRSATDRQESVSMIQHSQLPLVFDARHMTQQSSFHSMA